MPKILVVEDEKIVAMEIQDRLEGLKYNVLSVVSSGEEAINRVEEERPDLALMDIVLRGDMDGVETARKIRSQFNIPVIYLTAFAGEETLQRAKITEPFGYIIKPFDEKELRTSIEMALYRHQMEKQLKASEERYRVLYDDNPSMYFTVDSNGKILSVNKFGAKQLGYSPQELTGHSVLEIFHKDDQKAVQEQLTICLRNKDEIAQWEFRKICRDGSMMWVSELARAVENADGKIAVLIVCENITKRKKAEEALEAEKERLAVTLRSIGDGVIKTDINGHIVLINKVAETLTGWTQEEAANRLLSEVFHIIDEKDRKRCQNPVDEVLKTGKIVGLNNGTILISSNNEERIIADSAAPIYDRKNKIIGVVLVFRDIVEERKLEEEIQKAQKLESIGLLAGGIAHDFNNILTAIMGNISLAKADLSKTSELFEILTEAEKASVQAKNLTHQLLTFARGGAPLKKAASIAELIRNSAAFTLSGSNVRCEYHFSKDTWAVEVDTGQISQVIQNIIVNSKQAMPKGGTIRVDVENVVIDDEKRLPVKKGKYVKISFADEGVGISTEHLPKVFDPYFTTKREGSGLGLTICYSIIKKHGGFIFAESVVNNGATFAIYLPVSEKPIITSEEIPVTFPPRKGKILVMDDEAFIRHFLNRMLPRFGYMVEIVENGSDAIKRYFNALDSPQPFDAVILDLTIPGGMGGKETIEKLLQIDPSVKAIVASGYSNDPIMADYQDYGFAGAIFKPYKIDELQMVINRVLGA
ncbi:PAS domain S-box protein [candidate division KSB1 bacterium]|nr:PAS domain S-box protein [candidate division KSB1 bacterium]